MSNTCEHGHKGCVWNDGHLEWLKEVLPKTHAAHDGKIEDCDNPLCQDGLRWLREHGRTLAS
jgi:hypothetical protein